MESEIVEVTPELAAEWLAHAGMNRQSRVRKVQEYAATMWAGAWLLNGEAVKFNGHGQLVDGQHRLLAIIAAQTPIRCLVVRGLEEGAFETLDTGVPRRASDLLTALGHRHAVAICAALRVLKQFWYFEKTGTFPHENWRITLAPPEARRLVDEHPGLNEWVLLANRIRKARVPGGEGLWAGILYYCSRLDDENADEDAKVFAERVIDGTGLDEDDSILVLRNKLISIPQPIRRHFTSPEVAALIVKAWNSYRKGTKITLLKWARGGAHPEDFPTPI